MCYLRFLNSFVSSNSVTYSNPASIRVVASWMLLAVLHVHSSSFRFNSCVYIMVVLIWVCPILFITNRMSLVFAYSMVAK